MHHFMKSPYRYSLILSAVILSACGGGGSSDKDQQKTSEIQSGSFSALPVKGLYYETETLSGMTDETGSFKYREGEQISFSLGETQLGTTEAAPEITPFDLLSISPSTNEAEIAATLKSPMISSLDLVLNASALLLSLDVDGNFDNGIDLGNAHTALKDQELEIAIKAKDFANTPDIQNTVSRLVNRMPVSFIEAANQLYQNMQLTLITNRVSASTVTGDENQRSTAQYNEHGELETENIILSESDSPIELNYEYDSQNRLTQLSNSYTNQTELLTYNQDRLSQRILKDNDSLAESRETFNYDAQGQLSQFQLDKDGDGTSDSITSFNYSESSEQITVSELIDGTQTESVSVKHFSEGLVNRITEDYNNDGIPELEFFYTYDEHSRMSSRRIVSNDPSIESDTSYFEYDNQDRMIRYRQDTNNDEIIDYIEAYEYDINDNRTAFRRDLNADNQWDFVAFYRFDANGNRIEINEDSDGNGIVDMHWQAELQEIALESNWDNISSEL